MNKPLTYLQQFKYAGWQNYNHYLNFSDTHYDSQHHHASYRAVSKCKEMTCMALRFILKSFVFDLLFQGGIFQALRDNMCVLNR
eukprot:CAMPEP_0202694200 /NCGR_PEP_ID=MMETSP1385-20130828/8125_1 /ASSEMBLY_ACC=CAM_ASM_000861 /TAXON_ID=933848 /ORGANISM="Elphidium margaritaceum" /LENGTH=83 /DNA_ID=CAMNT_0049350005 /DNA_START=58 /DNA_END=305 /DNA_ORIENTATION=-